MYTTSCLTAKAKRNRRKFKELVYDSMAQNLERIENKKQSK